MATIFQVMLYLHIIAGFSALICGFLSMINRKGASAHLLTGKIFFASMTFVFITATAIAIFKKLPFLFMVGFFSYYLACSGYRILYLHRTKQTKPALLDWLISSIGILAGLALVIFSLQWFQTRGAWGFVPLSFGIFCITIGISDIRNLLNNSEEPNQRIRMHGTRMGAAFATTLTAFIVVNLSLGVYSWILWILPGVLSAIWISRTGNKHIRSSGEEIVSPFQTEVPPFKNEFI